MLSSDRDREKIELDDDDTDIACRCRSGGAGGGGSYEEHKLATDGLYSGEYVPGSCTYVSERFCVEAYREGDDSAIDRNGVLR